MVKSPNDDKISCYGKKIDCPKREHCELGEVCLSRARESADDLHYQLQHVSVPEIIYNPNEDGHHHRHGGFNDENDTAKAYYGAVSDETAEEESIDIPGVSLDEDTKPIVMQVVEKIAEWYFYTPHTFDALMNKIVRGKSQSDIAKERHITRQCVNKRLLRELGIAQKRNDIQERRDRELENAKRKITEYIDVLRERDEFLSKLSERNWKIYLYRFFEHRTVKETALLVKCNMRTVFRVSQKLRQKLGNSVILEEENCKNRIKRKYRKKTRNGTWKKTLK